MHQRARLVSLPRFPDFAVASQAPLPFHFEPADPRPPWIVRLAKIHAARHTNGEKRKEEEED